MQAAEALTEAQELMGDASGFIVTFNYFKRYLNRALGIFGQKLDDSARTTISLVQSQQAYALGSGVRSVLDVRLVPENTTNTTVPLAPMRLNDIPYHTNVEQDPTHYYLQPSGGTNSNELSMHLWPSPGRSASNAIIVDYTPRYDIVSSSDYIPLAHWAHPYIVQYAIGCALSDRADDADVQQGERFKATALREFATFRAFQPLAYMAQSTRRFP